MHLSVLHLFHVNLIGLHLCCALLDQLHLHLLLGPFLVPHLSDLLELLHTHTPLNNLFPVDSHSADVNLGNPHLYRALMDQLQLHLLQGPLLVTCLHFNVS